jgi:hypothetical protein
MVLRADWEPSDADDRGDGRVAGRAATSSATAACFGERESLHWRRAFIHASDLGVFNEFIGC